MVPKVVQDAGYTAVGLGVLALQQGSGRKVLIIAVPEHNDAVLDGEVVLVMIRLPHLSEDGKDTTHLQHHLDSCISIVNGDSARPEMAGTGASASPSSSAPTSQ